MRGEGEERRRGQGGRKQGRAEEKQGKQLGFN